ncbi:UPF0389 protein CG9231 [Onthophagus taurus]|uniref:UPF0389 protein CG9231 n=1 Tax=Onthophagus taurus TaxID=166361 RepID=UPI000C2037B2|nr:UPF0389 protein CG9231 [Onthophagus taurus]
MANLLKSLTIRNAQNIRSIFLSSVRSINPNLHKVNNFEKKMLVWTKKFKTVEEVPNLLPSEMVDKARNRIRIRVANYMMAATLIACVVVAFSGRRLRDQGDSLTKRNLEWHAKMNEEFKKREEEELKRQQQNN